MILLDTHALIWFVDELKKLPAKALKQINSRIDKEMILVSSITIWEIALLIKKGRLKLFLDIDSWIKKVESLSFIQFIPVDNQIAMESVNLPGQFNKDPADRIIIATARKLGATLITGGQRIRKYPHVQSTW